MYEQGWLTKRFDEHRPRLQRVAYGMLGSLREAEDAVLEAWRRLHRVDPETIDDLGGWLTTVVSRLCLDALRLRKLRAEHQESGLLPEDDSGSDAEAMLADSVDAALLRALDTLTPSERLAFVLHHLFAMPFDEIGAIVGETPGVAGQLANGARRRLRAEMARGG